MRLADEIDFGTWWSNTAHGFPRYRVTWNPTSGALYASCHQSRRAEVFCKVARREDVDALMDGYPDVMHDAGSLDWIRNRCSERADELAGITGGDRSSPTP